VPIEITMLAYGDGEATNFDASGSFSGGAQLNPDFLHTLSWGRTTTVTNPATGEVIDDWSITSLFGFGYRSPVPEPAGATLFAFRVDFCHWHKTGGGHMSGHSSVGGRPFSRH